jgi:hypothetical protein
MSTERRPRGAPRLLAALAVALLLGGCSRWVPGPISYAVVARGTVQGHEWAVLARAARHEQPSAEFRSELSLGGHYVRGGGIWVRGTYSPDAVQVPGTKRWVIYGAVPAEVQAVALADDVHRGAAEPGTRVRTVAFPGFPGRFFGFLLPAGSRRLQGFDYREGRDAVSPGAAILYDAQGRPLPPKGS